jgi:hypothetical protein
MRKILFTTVAVTALSCAGVAAQTQEHQGSMSGPGGQGATSSEHANPSGAHGAMSGPEHGAGGGGAMGHHAEGAGQGTMGHRAEGAEQKEQGSRSAGQQTGATEGKGSMGKEGTRSTERSAERRGEEQGNKSADQQRGGEYSNKSAEEQRGREHDRSMTGQRENERTNRSMSEQRGGGVRTGRAVEEGEGGRGHARIDAGQRSRIVNTIRRTHVETINHVDFAINVGTVVPTSYHFYPLPPEIVSIVPEYQGYDYIVVGNQILIIDPGTYRIVDVIDEAG